MKCMKKIFEKFLSSKKLKISAFLGFFVTFLMVFYLVFIPSFVSNSHFISTVEKVLKDSYFADIHIEKPFIKTSLSPNVSFGFDSLKINRNDKLVLNVKDLDTTVSWGAILKGKIILKNLGVQGLDMDVNQLLDILPKSSNGKPSKPLQIEWLDSSLALNNCNIVYSILDDTKITISGKNLEIVKSKEPKFVHFNVFFDIKQPKNALKIHFFDENNIYIKNHKLYVDKFSLNIDKSRVLMDAVCDKNNNFDISLNSKNFDVKTLSNIVSTNLIIPQGKELLNLINNEKGSFDFDINMTNKNLDGKVFCRKVYFELPDVNNIPIEITNGDIKLTKNTIFLTNFDGFYGKNRQNFINMEGKIDDYIKTFQSKLEISANITNDLLKKYISPLIGMDISLISPTKSKIIVKTLFDKIDITIVSKIPKGNSILTDGNSLSPKDYDRAFLADMTLKKNILKINSINYYIAQNLTRGSKVAPILKLNGELDIAKGGYINNFGFEIPKPLPSEFLNMLVGPHFFKKGTISGNLQFLNDEKAPKISGNLSLEGARIPAHRLFIKQGLVKCSNDSIFIDSEGRFRKAKYNIKGNIQNKLLCPIIVNNISLTVDNLDIQRIMNSFNNIQTQATQPQQPVIINDDDDDMDEDYAFNPDLLIIKECNLNVIKGSYKEIEFADVLAKMALDDKGVLTLSSNKFDFAEGTSSCKAVCDLKNQKYQIKLGAKEVNSDIIATSLLGLKREITGKASAIIELYSDKSLKLNGKMKFLVKDGTIEKIGLVEYVLKFASFFRNPMAMISPGMIIDLVNIPEGNFNKIDGHLDIKDNIVNSIQIKSSSPTLASYIAGSFDLESRDASLRIYTKFTSSHKGFSGFLRSISLNNIANKIQISNNDENYCSVELNQIPSLEVGEKTAQIFLTKVEGDVEHNNFLSYLKRIK